MISTPFKTIQPSSSSSRLKEWRPHPIMKIYRDNQIAVPIAILVSISVTALYNPTHPIAQLVSLSNLIVSAQQQAYGKSLFTDIAFVVWAILLWTVVRAVFMEFALRPFGRYLKCRPKMLDRFAEQGWLVIYYFSAFSVGLNIAMRAPYWGNTAHFWIDYPHKYLSRSFKMYYLLQLGFWIQQLLVIHIEKPRKDHWQMFGHHVVTCSLIIGSYITNYTRIGNAIMVMMDVGDIFLSLAKCFNYIQWRRTCDATFLIFVCVWIYSRHYLYYFILVSVYYEAPVLLKWGWNPSEGQFVNYEMLVLFMGLLSVLQLLLMMWFVLMVRVIMKVVGGNAAQDNRSDDESECPTSSTTTPTSSTTTPTSSTTTPTSTTTTPTSTTTTPTSTTTTPTSTTTTTTVDCEMKRTTYRIDEKYT